MAFFPGLLSGVICCSQLQHVLLTDGVVVPARVGSS